MSQEKELLARGAETVTGELVLNRKVVGRYRNGEFNVTEDGLMELSIVEVVARPVKEKEKAAVEDAPAPKPRAKGKAKAKVEAEPTPEPEDETPADDAVVNDELTDLLND